MSAYDEIKALPAKYHGIQFRSRLEARWAAYFDLIGLEWVYEPEGYSLPSGPYVPDFACFDFFVEVKPTIAERDRIEPKLHELAKMTGKDVYCVVGFPSREMQWSAGHWGAFCYYAFSTKRWGVPYFGSVAGMHPDDEEYVRLANELQFGRDGVALQDYWAPKKKAWAA